MLKSSIKSILATWLAGLLVVLPLALTLALLAWLASLFAKLLGPATLVGQLFSVLGEPLTKNPLLAYWLGTLLLIAAVYCLGFAVQRGLKAPLTKLINAVLGRIPVISKLYGLAERFVALVDKQEGAADISAMSPVWCFFGGKGAAALALLPNPKTVLIDGRDYYAVLIPTAPIPVGGGLLYVPKDWVKPADMGIDTFSSIYLSMGINPPKIPLNEKPTTSSDDLPEKPLS